jgi:type VI secretion system protein ImpL
MGLSIGLNKNFVAALNRSQKITDSLFKRGGMTPEMTFYLYPMPTPGISEITLETNGQIYRYRNEPQEWRKFQWPGESDRTGASVVAVSEKNNMRAQHEEQGMWGIFHLFRKAHLVKERGTQYLSQWNMEAINGKPVRVSFRVKADRSNNLLQPGLFNKYSIPKRIIGQSRRGTNVADRG